MKFLADENFNGHVIHALARRLPAGALIRVQDVGLMEAADPIILAWAAENQFILLTHDIRTIPAFVNDRVAMPLPMPGVFVVGTRASIQMIVEDLMLAFECGSDDEWADRVTHIPL